MGKVLVNVLGVRRAAVFQHHALLLGVEGDLVVSHILYAAQLIEEPVDDLAAEDGPFDDLVAVLQLHMRVEDTLRFDLQQRSHLAEAVAAALFEVDGVVSALMAQRHARFEPALFAFGLQVVVDLQRAARNAARTGADEDLALIRRQQLLGLHAQGIQALSCQLSHSAHPPLPGYPQAAQAPSRGPSLHAPRRRSS